MFLDPGEGVNVFLGQVDSLAVQVIQVGIENIAGQFVADAEIAEMRELQLPGNQNIGAGLVNSGRNRLIPGGVVNLCVGAGDKEAQGQSRDRACFPGEGSQGRALHGVFRNGHKCIPEAAGNRHQ